jgi:3',5'-cyclic-AMP phosphodiesterase
VTVTTVGPPGRALRSGPMNGPPLLVAQITDCHIVEPDTLWAGRIDTAATLARVVERLNTMAPRPDVVVVTGDLVNDARPEQYAHLGVILSDLEPPLVVLPGNHDDRTELRALFPQIPAGGPEERIDVVVDDFGLRIIGLDTTIPGAPGGRYTVDQMGWLDDVLANAPDRPTMIFQHHPPFTTGIAWMDANAFVDAHLMEPVVERHRQVLGVACGHMHRAITSRVGVTVCTVSPSTAAQLALVLDGTPFLYCDDPPAITLHRWVPGGPVVSHVAVVDDTQPWVPGWGGPAGR